MEMKDNFVQAVKELLTPPGGEREHKGKPEEANLTVVIPGKKPGTVPPPLEPDLGELEGRNKKFGKSASPRPSVTLPADSDTPENLEHTCIAPGAHVEGTLKGRGSVDVFGSVKGDVVCEGDLALCGKLIGDVQCRNIVMRSGKMTGTITASGRVEVDADSVIDGDIKADGLVLNGKVKGDLVIAHTLTLGGCAEVQGNLTATTLAVSQGCIIHGLVQVCPENKRGTSDKKPSELN